VKLREWPVNLSVRFPRTVLGLARLLTVLCEVKYNVGLADDAFTERSLRRPPAQWIFGD